MKKSVLLVPLLVAAGLFGCADAEQRADAIRTQAQGAVDAKVAEAKAAAAKKAAEAAAEAQRQLLAKVDPDGKLQNSAQQMQEGQSMIAKMQEGKTMDPAVQAWIQKQLASSNEVVQAIAIPVMNRAYEQFPEKRAWLQAEAKKAMATTEGAAKTAWQDAIDSWTRIESVAAAQR